MVIIFGELLIEIGFGTKFATDPGPELALDPDPATDPVPNPEEDDEEVDGALERAVRINGEGLEDVPCRGARSEGDDEDLDDEDDVDDKRPCCVDPEKGIPLPAYTPVVEIYCCEEV